MRQVEGWGDALRVWGRNAVKFGCDDCCTSTNVIKFIKKKKIYGIQMQSSSEENL